MSRNRNLELMFELGALRFIERAWKQFFSPDFANLAEHHLRVMWIALLLARMEKCKNTEKILKMALVHDVSESRTGDVHYISRQYTKRDELKAIKDIFKDTDLEHEMTSLWIEYSAHKSKESQIVKDADWLDVDFEIREQKTMGRKHMEAWDDNRIIMKGLFYTKSAVKIWEQVQKSNPSDWYRFARNRFGEGDLKQRIISKKKHD